MEGRLKIHPANSSCDGKRYTPRRTQTLGICKFPTVEDAREVSKFTKEKGIGKDAVIAYKIWRNIAVVLADPIGPEIKKREMAKDFIIQFFTNGLLANRLDL